MLNEFKVLLNSIGQTTHKKISSCEKNPERRKFRCKVSQNVLINFITIEKVNYLFLHLIINFIYLITFVKFISLSVDTVATFNKVVSLFE